jgi:uncharacterized protein
MTYKKFNKALIRIKPSGIVKGQVGVFAVRNLTKGTIIGDVRFLNEDLFFTWDEYKKIDHKSKALIKDFCITTQEGIYGPRDINYISIPWHINHCCDGNVGFDAKGNFITIKNMKEGQELCFDYGLCYSDPNYTLICNCGAKNCRKKITGNDWKNTAYRKKNYKYMTPELKELIKREAI